MDIIALFKAVMVGFFTFMIAIGAVLSVVSAIAKQSMVKSVPVRKSPAILMFVFVLLGGWGGIYWAFSLLSGVDDNAKQQAMMIYAYLFALVPSVALMLSSLIYYLDVRSAAKKEMGQ